MLSEFMKLSYGLLYKSCQLLKNNKLLCHHSTGTFLTTYSIINMVQQIYIQKTNVRTKLLFSSYIYFLYVYLLYHIYDIASSQKCACAMMAQKFHYLFSEKKKKKKMDVTPIYFRFFYCCDLQN